MLRRFDVGWPIVTQSSRMFSALSGGVIIALQKGVTYLQSGLTRFVPDQDTVIEVLAVLGIVTAAYLLSGIGNLQTVKQQFSISVSEASPATIQK